MKPISYINSKTQYLQNFHSCPHDSIEDNVLKPRETNLDANYEISRW
jgi:hypothetical protein